MGDEGVGQGAAQEQFDDVQQCVPFSFTVFRTLTFTYRQVDGIRKGEDAEGKKQGLMDKIKSMCNGISDLIPQQHKNKANDHFTR